MRLIATLWTVAHQAFPVHGILQAGILIGVGCHALLLSQVVKNLCASISLFMKETLLNLMLIHIPKGGW